MSGKEILTENMLTIWLKMKAMSVILPKKLLLKLLLTMIFRFNGSNSRTKI